MTIETRFGPYGGRFVPETLIPALDELTAAYEEARADAAFQAELAYLLADYAGRPTPLFHAARLSERCRATILLKREDLCHTGAHKINNVLGQALLAKRMGKRRVIAETGAGQHGVATATACALLDLECVVYMGAEDVRRQELNVVRMRLLGAQVVPVESGSRTLKDAMNEALRDWVTNVRETFYVIGSVAGPAPYPAMVRDFQAVIGAETIAQVRERFGHLPDEIVACVGGGSNAMGIFHAFRDLASVRLTGVEAAGEGLDGRHGAPLAKGSPGVLHGSYSYLLQDAWGQVAEAHSISAGLDYPGVGPEHSWLKDSGRAAYAAATDDEALAAFRTLAELEGIIPALESAHAVAYVLRGPSDTEPTAPSPSQTGRFTIPGEAEFDPAATRFARGDLVIVNLSGRGDKDVYEAGARLGAAVMSVRKLPHPPQEPEHKPPTTPVDDPASAADPVETAARRPAGRLAPRLARAFSKPRAQRAALIPYLTGGHPDLKTSDRLIATLVDAGADIVELGVPFSDPIADGPVVQQSTHTALTAGITPDDVLGLAAAHSAGAPFVLLTYLNSILAFGAERFFTRAATAGVEALVIPDLPLDEAAGQMVSLAREAGGLAALAAGAGVSLVPMATPTSTDERLDLVAAAATSFIYCVAVTGVTGARAEVGAELPALLARLRERTDAPLAVGFGISTPEQAAGVAGLADGVIIGSALIDAVTRAATPDDACAAARSLVSAASAAIAAG